MNCRTCGLILPVEWGGGEHLFSVHEGPRRTTKNTFFVREGARRGRENRAIASKFGRHNSPRRAPTRGAPTDDMPWGGRPRGAPLPTVCPGEGTHEGCPYRFRQPQVGLYRFDAIALPLRTPNIFLSTEGCGEHLNTFLSTKGHEGPRRKPFFPPRRATKGQEEHLFVREGARRGRENRAIASKFGRHNSPRRAPTRGAPTDSGSLRWVCTDLMQLPWG